MKYRRRDKDSSLGTPFLCPGICVLGSGDSHLIQLPPKSWLFGFLHHTTIFFFLRKTCSMSDKATLKEQLPYFFLELNALWWVSLNPVWAQCRFVCSISCGNTIKFLSSSALLSNINVFRSLLYSASTTGQKSHAANHLVSTSRSSRTRTCIHNFKINVSAWP